MTQCCRGFACATGAGLGKGDAEGLGASPTFPAIALCTPPAPSAEWRSPGGGGPMVAGVEEPSSGSRGGPGARGRDREHSLRSAASRHSPAAPISPPHPTPPGLWVSPCRRGRAGQRMLSRAISACSVPGRGGGMLRFLTPLPARLPCCRRKPARCRRPEPRPELRCEAGAKPVPWAPRSTSGHLRVPWALPSPCAPCTAHAP